MNSTSGLQVEPENTYTQVVDASFRVTMAALGENLIGVGRTCVKVVVDDKEFVLCSLSPDKVWNGIILWLEM
jgi:FK506-binding nuclear protein